MNESEVVSFALKHLLPYSESCGLEEDLQWIGTHDDFLKFAKAIYEKGRCDGVNETNAN
jgi:hypothetical protein